jgi:endonuclease/exonuclease/phosphatase family metal-dependent hydrolase
LQEDIHDIPKVQQEVNYKTNTNLQSSESQMLAPNDNQWKPFSSEDKMFEVLHRFVSKCHTTLNRVGGIMKSMSGRSLAYPFHGFHGLGKLDVQEIEEVNKDKKDSAHNSDNNNDSEINYNYNEHEKEHENENEHKNEYNMDTGKDLQDVSVSLSIMPSNSSRDLLELGGTGSPTLGAQDTGKTILQDYPSVANLHHTTNTGVDDIECPQVKLVINNIAGVGMKTKKLQRVLEWMETNQFDILLAQEANVSFRHQQVQQYFRDTLRSGYHLTTSETEFYFKGPNKPGGTFVLTNERLRFRILRTISDPAGRWAGNIYAFKGGFKVAFVSFYQICQWKKTGGTTSRAQQVAWLSKQNRPLDPLEAYREDVSTLIDKLQQESTELLLAGDFNEHDMTKGTLFELCQKGLIPLQGISPEATYQRGKTCIDHMFVTPGLFHKIQDTKYHPYPSDFDSDHCPMEITLQVDYRPISLVSNILQERRLYSNSFKDVRRYILHRLKLHKQYRISEKILQISAMKNNTDLTSSATFTSSLATKLDKVDMQNTRICLESEKSLRLKNKIHRSTQIKAILAELHQIRYDMHNAKRNKELLKIKALTKAKRQANRNLIQAYRNQWKVHESYHNNEVKKLAKLEPCGKQAARVQTLDASRRKLQRVYRKLSFITGKRKDKENIKLQADNQWITDPDDVSQMIVLNNKDHFSQAKGCFFSNREFSEIVNPHSEVFDTMTVPTLEKEFIETLRSKQLVPIPTEIDIQEWKKKFKTWRESTRTSPSGLHLGHFKSLLVNVYTQDNGKCEVDNEIASAQLELFEATLDIVNLAIVSERPLSRWKVATNIVIPKKKGSNDVKHLRNIHIYECDLNALLSLKWKEALSNAETEDFIIQSQCGSRKEKSSHDPVFMETAQLEIARLTRKQYGQINYDARACYDRILPNLAAMTSLVHGVPESLVHLHNRLLLGMTYHVHIEGASERATYAGDEHNMVYGSGQGCGNSPFIWLFISNILLKMFQQRAKGATYRSYRSTSALAIPVSAYVDDINTHHNIESGQNCLEEQMKQEFIQWKDILEMSGGSLAQEKCNYYTVTWKFHNSGRPEMDDTMKEAMHVTTTGTTLQSIKQEHKTLGFYISPKSPRDFQQLQWKDIENRFGLMLDLYDLTHREVDILYKRIYVPTVRYLLPFITLSAKQIQHITKFTITKFLRQTGYSNNTARDIVYGSTLLGGLGWVDMEIEQGLHNLATLIQNYHNGGIKGSLLQILLERWSWFIGFCPFQHHILNIVYDESQWLSSIAVFVKKHNITLSIRSPVAPLLRENDEYIMVIVHSMNLSPTEIRYINYCRLYLNVISVADLSDEDGNYIRQEMYENYAHMINNSSSNCTQYAPPIRKWSLWRKVLNHLTFHNRRKLRQSLGKWIVASDVIRKKYLYYSDSHTLFQLTSNNVLTYAIHNKTKGNSTGQTNHIPTDAYPCLITPTGHLLSSITFELNLTAENDAMEEYNGNIIAVTDASVVGNQGTWAAILTDPVGKELGQLQGSLTDDDLTSFRAELDGCRGVMKLLQRYPKCNQITLFCDNAAVISRLNTLKYSTPSINWSDYDLLLEVKQTMPKNISFKHVKGHQSSRCQSDLPLETNLNILMDMRAKQAQDNIPPYCYTPRLTIQYNGKSITGHLINGLRQEISSERIRMHYKYKMKDLYKEVYWEAFQYACVKGKITKSIIKLIHNIAPTLYTFYRRRLSYDALCPICFQADETSQHVLICQSRSDIYNQMFCEKVRIRLKLKQDFNTKILQDIFKSITTSPEGELAAIEFSQQQQLGWSYCIRGFVTLEWIKVAHLFPIDKPKHEIIGSIIIEMWNVWSAAWTQRNQMFKEEDRYMAQCALKQRTVDLRIIYECKDYIPIELQDNLKQSAEEHLKLDNVVIDEWLKMYRPIFHRVIDEQDTELWRKTEKEVLESLEL